MKALIIDDNKINRLYLKTLLEKSFPVIKKIDEAGTVSASKLLIESTDYDVIFLEIELKDGMGFEVLKEIKDFVHVVVVTNRKEHAIQAIKHSVIDYLLKPVDLNEMKIALSRIVKLAGKQETSKKPSSGSDYPRTSVFEESAIMINFKNQCKALNKKDILFIKALGKYSEIHVINKSHYTSYKNLKEFEYAMTDTFVRTHHSYLVNLESIVSYSRETSQVELCNGIFIPVSVRKREELFKKFKVF
ncbi:LytR/AlgR family response regulator transcription factor [Aurantibacillus circumpalustris]|uniref:LytR/AlgR family response regulator transcription factor n=1 Tax=Aurantibacillus circumpalustris TaxID=3036359 RepID=UPI00295AF2AA|nr:LytTR family DNA-binding domain-containing protein [Aurantibacillus circumpalustris]